MNKQKFTWITIVALLLIGGLYMVIRGQGPAEPRQPQAAPQALHPDRLVRSYSPILGPPQAPVTIVEFFDPACEACRAFYPLVKDLMKQYPQEVRLVLRYAAFHPGSDQVVRLLEASKQQNKYWEVLDALLVTQPMWADHSRPNIDLAYQSARQAGLDLQKARADAATAQMDTLLEQERADLIALKIEKTPTFFVNGEGLPSFGPEQLAALVARKVAEASHK